jgi:hypothetical protein
MSLDVGRYQLYSSFRTAAAHWDQTQLAWRDEAARNFEEQHWRPLELQVKLTLSAMDQLGQIVDRARRECS